MFSNTLLDNRHVMIIPKEYVKNERGNNGPYSYLMKHFCGKVKWLSRIRRFNSDYLANRAVYTCGHIFSHIDRLEQAGAKDIRAIKELSTDYETLDIETVTLGKVPTSVYDIGVFFPCRFTPFKCFKNLLDAHVPRHAKQQLNGTKYTLPVWSSYICPLDQVIITKVNNMAKEMFLHSTKVTHVSATVYRGESSLFFNIPKQTKIVVFCTFYNKCKSSEIKQSDLDIYDHRYKKKISVLSVLRFTIKKPNVHMKKTFDLLLYPGSMFAFSRSIYDLYSYDMIPAHILGVKTPDTMLYSLYL